jgi:hypothetical protein
MPRLLALAAALAAPALDLPDLFADQLPRVRDKTELAILLPQKLPDQFTEYHPSGFGRRNSWGLQIGAVPGCGGATACFVASFSARKGGTPFGRRKLTLANGRKGRFQPLSCGASCSPPSISWRERGATFSIQANVSVKGVPDRRLFRRMANSAIRNGPR